MKKPISRSPFARNVLTLMTGTTVAQAIPVAISPVLTRLYTPADFGILAIFIAITSIFGSIANGRYELAIMLPEKNEDALNIAAFGVVITATLSIALLILVLIFNARISNLLGDEAIGGWLYLAPFSIFFIGLFNVLNYYNTRMKQYKDIAVANISKSLVLAIVQLGIGFVKLGASGLIVGQFMSALVANFRLAKNVLRGMDFESAISWIKMKRVAIRYKDFPKFSMWAILANTLSVNLVTLLISVFYSVSTLGFYSIVQRVLGMPSSLVGGAIGQVYFQQATMEKQATGKANDIFNQTIKKLTVISILFFVPIFFLVEDVFALVFGEKWRIAGVYAQIMVPLFALRFVVSTVSVTNSVFEKQKISLLWQLGLLFLSMAIMFFAEIRGLNFETFLQLLTAVLMAYYVLLYFVLLHVSQGRL